LFSINTACKMKVYGESDENVDDAELITMPFLKFMVEKQDGIDVKYDFPRFTYSCIAEDNTTHLQSEAFLALTNKLGLAQKPANQINNTASLEDAYQGFVLHNDKLYMFFNYDLILQHFTTISPTTINNSNNALPASSVAEIQATNVSEYTWAIVDELVFQKQCNHVPVEPSISQLFLDNPILWNIEYRGTYLDFPFCLYGVVENSENDTLMNEHRSVTQTIIPNTPHKLIIGHTTDNYEFGNDFGEMYLFSNSTIIPQDRESAKYAVFVSGVKYLINETQHANFFKYMETEINNNLGNVTKTIVGGDDDNTNNNEINVNEESEEDDNSEVHVIYFIEPKLNKQLWGVRHAYRFVSL